MLKLLKNKMKSRKGILSDVSWQTIGLFLTLVLIVGIVFVNAKKLQDRGTNNVTNMTNIESQIKNKSFTEPSGGLQ